MLPIPGRVGDPGLQGEALRLFLVNLLLDVLDVAPQTLPLRRHSRSRVCELLAQLLQLLLRLLRVLNEKQILLLQGCENVQELLRLVEVHGKVVPRVRQLLLVDLRLLRQVRPRQLVPLLLVAWVPSPTAPALLAFPLLKLPRELHLLLLMLLEDPPLLLLPLGHALIVALLAALHLPVGLVLLARLHEVRGRELVQELLAFDAVCQLLVVLCNVRLHHLDLLVQPFDLRRLLELELGLLLRLLHRTVRLLVVLLEKRIKADRILLQHLLTLLERLLLQLGLAL
mmetsp:Transcript_6032/g.23433  ORF Transcript_6032/g.23433 Transcript_6032/m.23433 type:complete len:284 (+) Transcript_6032:468-1319(+)